MLALLQNRLAKIKAENSYRILSQRNGIDLTSNDYLGFAEDHILREAFLKKLDNIPLGSTGSRLLHGNLKIFEETEEVLAHFVKRQSAIFFPSGYQANLALFSSLLQPGDIAFSDSLNHASIIDGLHLSKAQKVIFPHRDYQFLEDQLKSNHTKDKLKVIITESLFSMEGTLADLELLAKLANHYGALLVVDEAHSTGIWGSSLVATLGLTDQVFATVHTGGKALGTAGAWIAGDHILKELMVNFARAFIFSTAPLPLQAHLLQTAITVYQQIGSERAKIVLDRSKTFRTLLASGHLSSTSPIVSLLLGENEFALKVGQELQKNGWDVRGIRPPLSS